jgi:hypothetical protein
VLISTKASCLAGTHYQEARRQQRIDEIDSSPSGDKVAYTVRHFGYEHDKPISQLWLQTWRFLDHAASSHLTSIITQ